MSDEPSSQPETESPTGGVPLPVLIVDDNADHAFLVARALRRSESPFLPIMAEDAAACLEIIQRQRPAAVVLDYQLPDMDGLTLFTRVRELAPQVPIVIVTGMGSVQIAVSAMKLGAADYVVKEGEYYNALPDIVTLSIERFQQQTEPARQEAIPAPRHDAPAVLPDGEFRSRAGHRIAEALGSGRCLSLLRIVVARDATDAAAVGPSEQILAGMLLRTARDEDLVGHDGSGGFAVLGLGASQQGAARLAERIRAALLQRTAAAGGAAPPSIAIGFATLPQAGGSLADLWQQAGAALAAGIARESSQSNAAIEPAIGAAPAANQLALQRRETLARLTEAYERGESRGVAIYAHADACTICCNAALDVYLPRFAPALPLVGCTNPDGCRCDYRAPGIDPRRSPPPIPAEGRPDLDIPRRLRSAALFGSEPKGSCKPEDLAEFLDAFPLLPFAADIELHPGEAGYLARPARRAWERATPAGSAIHGPAFPLTGSLRAWVKQTGKAPFLPGDVIPFREDGELYLTNWRLIFVRRGTIESVLLADITGIELLRDGIGCILGERDHRLVFLLRDPLQAGLCVAKAIGDLAAF